MHKKTLLILFGELRTFEYVIPNLQRLDEVDIVLSTWNVSSRYNSLFYVDESMITKILPNITQFHILDTEEIPNYNEKGNPWKMAFHWKTAINNLENPEQYDTVIVHRCDLMSNWHSILDLDIQEDTLYFHHGTEPHFHQNKNAFWINDYYFFGKFNMVKNFINSFDKDNYDAPHYNIWEVINDKKIKISKYVLQGSLIRDHDIVYAIEFVESELTVNNLSKLIGPNNC